MSKMFLILMLSLLSFLMSSCKTTQQAVISTCPPEGYFLIKKDVHRDLLEACARTKGELNECLERERKK